MNEQDRGLELKVGIFVAVGLAILAALIVQFGRIGEGFKSYYTITVHFADASGLLKSSDVLMGGAKVGQVGGAPRLVTVGRGVEVPLKIYDFVKIPVGSSITVGSSGLLGDRFVAIFPPTEKPTAYIAHGARVEGAREEGLDDITKEGGALIKDLRGTVAKIDTAVSKLNDDALSKANMAHLKETFDNLSKTTAALSESSKKIDGVIEKADGTMGSAKEAADKIQVAVADAQKTIQSASRILNEATKGDGLIPLLLTNQDVANDLRALISNLRRHGVLFYRDSAAKIAPPPENTPPPRRRSNR
ncbi:MAG: MlaD family protein [Verrucomicrobiota bacterium]|nr:MlaD family protein [Verrucomicrobiota bacterium]